MESGFIYHTGQDRGKVFSFRPQPHPLGVLAKRTTYGATAATKRGDLAKRGDMLLLALSQSFSLIIPGASLSGNVVARDFSVHALEQSRQHASRTDLIKLGDA
jgi:hypothetical protein